MTSIYTVKPGLKACLIEIKAKKIDGSDFKMFKMVWANFWIENKFEKTYFF